MRRRCSASRRASSSGRGQCEAAHALDVGASTVLGAIGVEVAVVRLALVDVIGVEYGAPGVEAALVFGIVDVLRVEAVQCSARRRRGEPVLGADGVEVPSSPASRGRRLPRPHLDVLGVDVLDVEPVPVLGAMWSRASTCSAQWRSPPSRESPSRSPRSPPSRRGRRRCNHEQPRGTIPCSGRRGWIWPPRVCRRAGRRRPRRACRAHVVLAADRDAVERDAAGRAELSLLLASCVDVVERPYVLAAVRRRRGRAPCRLPPAISRGSRASSPCAGRAASDR
jgi:hypothetical protein